MNHFALYSADHQGYATTNLGWTVWRSEAKTFETAEQAHDYRRNVLGLADTTIADDRGCYVCHASRRSL